MPSTQELVAALRPVIREEVERQAVVITGGRRVRIPETGEVPDSDKAHVSNADVLTALEKQGDRIVAAIERLAEKEQQ